MGSSLMEAWARSVVIKFLGSFISHGTLILVEDGGSTYTFEGDGKKCCVKTVVRVHNPQFYWKVMTRSYIGLADAYIDGDFSLEDECLLNFFLVLIANKEADKYISNVKNKREWWSPSNLIASITSTIFYVRHVFRQNTLTQARRNISHHYDHQINGELLASCLGGTMVYSCAIFKTENEDLNTAQLRKLHTLIEKAKIEKDHEVLEFGCGWGTFAIEVVKRTGCRYTGITLSKEQLKYAETKVQEAGLQDRIKLLLCDYRELRDTHKYNRIIACEMIEHVGDKYLEKFFECCESLLAEDGLFILQFISKPDHSYKEHKKSPGFLREYMFHGGCLPSLSRVTSAMAAASKLSVEHVENIGSHYIDTTKHWKNNFKQNRRKLLELGYNEKIIRTWEYFLDYFAAGFQLGTRGEYQIVFSRPGNRTLLGDPYKGFPSAYQFSIN